MLKGRETSLQYVIGDLIWSGGFVWCQFINGSFYLCDGDVWVRGHGVWIVCVWDIAEICWWCIKEIWQVYLKGGLSYSVYLCLLRDKWKKWEDKRSFIIIHIINWSKSRWDIFYFQVISLKKVTNRPNRTTPPLNRPNSFVKFPWCRSDPSDYQEWWWTLTPSKTFIHVQIYRLVSRGISVISQRWQFRRNQRNINCANAKLHTKCMQHRSTLKCWVKYVTEIYTIVTRMDIRRSIWVQTSTNY